jgi:hypothetical protein
LVSAPAFARLEQSVATEEDLVTLFELKGYSILGDFHNLASSDTNVHRNATLQRHLG